MPVNTLPLPNDTSTTNTLAVPTFSSFGSNLSLFDGPLQHQQPATTATLQNKSSSHLFTSLHSNSSFLLHNSNNSNNYIDNHNRNFFANDLPPNYQIDLQQKTQANQQIQRLYSFLISQQGQVTQVNQLQCQLIHSLLQHYNNSSKEEYKREAGEYKRQVEAVERQLWSLNHQLLSQLETLDTLRNSVLVHPQDSLNLKFIHSRLTSLQFKLEILRQELVHFSKSINNNNNNCLEVSMGEVGMLVVEEQPTSQVAFKGKMIEERYLVRLITGSFDNTNYTHSSLPKLGKVRAILVTDSPASGKKEVLENEETLFDTSQKAAIFQKLKINVSTRMSLVSLRFVAEMEGERGRRWTVQSNNSSPLVIITNESQWSDAAGKLFVYDCFSSSNSTTNNNNNSATTSSRITWPCFANCLQMHFLKSTRQDASSPSRPLHLADFNYLFSKFFKSNSIDQSSAIKFWGWFGPHLQNIRYSLSFPFLSRVMAAK